jgi:hypothetical protein
VDDKPASNDDPFGTRSVACQFPNMVYADWHTPDSQNIGLFIATVFFPIVSSRLSIAAASSFLTVSTNIVVTSLITFRLLRARCALAKVLPSADMRVYTGVIAILVESAAPLTIFGVIAAILQCLATQSPRSPGFYVFETLFDGLFYSFCVSRNNQLPQQMPSFLTSLFESHSPHT